MTLDPLRGESSEHQTMMERLDARDRGDERLAIMRHVRCGVGDRGRAWLSFDVFTSESSAALTILEWDRAKEVIEAYGVSDVHQLEGKPCWVDTSQPGMTTWISPAVFK